MKTILFVDDEVSLLNAYSLMLTKKGYRVLKAENATKGKEVLLGEDVDLVISDIYMPDENGLALVQQIKRMLKYRDVPIILLSAGCTKDNVFRGIEMGIYSFLTKPCSFDRLFETVRDALNTNGSSPKNGNGKGEAMGTYLSKISLLLVYGNANAKDYLPEFLSERFYKVYAEGNSDRIEDIITSKGINLLIIEVDSAADKNFEFLFNLYNRNKFLGMPIIVISEKAIELKPIFGEMGYHIDRLIGKPFVYGNLVEEILDVIDAKNIKRKLMLSQKKVEWELAEIRNRDLFYAATFRHEINRLKGENSLLFQQVKASQNNSAIPCIIKNNRKIDRLIKAVMSLRKLSIEKRAGLLDAARTSKLRINELKKVEMV